jgi:hypothetical protein
VLLYGMYAEDYGWGAGARAVRGVAGRSCCALCSTPRRAKPPVRSASRFARSSCVSTACSPELPDVPRRCVFRRDCGVLRGRARRVSP